MHTESFTRPVERTHAHRHRIGLWQSWSLIGNAWLDGRRSIPHTEGSAPGSVTTRTPMLGRDVARAEEFAAAEGIRFRWDVADRSERHSTVSDRLADLRADVDALELIDPTCPDEEQRRDEKLRRSMRQIMLLERELPQHAAAIDERFRIAQLRCERYFSYTEERIEYYWRSLRRRHRGAAGLSDRPELVDRPAWLRAEDGITALQIWNTTSKGTRHVR